VRRAGTVDLVRVDAGVETVLGSVPAAVDPAVFDRLTLRVSGTSAVRLVVSRNGTQVPSATDSSLARLASGRAGLLSGSSARTQYDAFLPTAP